MTLHHLRGGGTLVGTAAELAAAGLHTDQLGIEVGDDGAPTGVLHLGGSQLPGAGGDTSGLVPIASADGAVVDTATNPAAAEPMQVLVLPADTAVAFAIQIEGDDFPRYTFYADPQNGIKFSDGTFDAWAEGAEIKSTSRNLELVSQNTISINPVSDLIVLARTQAWGDVTFGDDANGPVMQDRTLGGPYRIVLDNGVLSVEPDLS